MGGAEFLTGQGEMAELIRTKDWAQTALGPIEAWPQSLRTAASLCLASNFPINLIWGSENTQIYNDGYRVVCGDAHPVALGQDYRVTWKSAWPAIGEPFARARRGETSFLENQRMFLTRNGYWEETFFTFSLSPIRDESGGIGGLFHPVAETTATMIAERRTRALRNLSTNLATASDIEGLCAKTIETLEEFPFSLPFVLFYQLEPDEAGYRLAAHCGVAPGTDVSPAQIAGEATAPWPFARARTASGFLEVEGVRALLRGADCGPYEEGPDNAIVAPIRLPGRERASAILVLGVSSRRPFDDGYRDFYQLLQTTIAAAYGVVSARAEERRRAEALAELDRAKTVFFSNVSHEFRTPLTLILGPIEDELAEPSTPRRERLETVHRNALRLMKLVNALLDFSRLEAGRMTAHFEPTDLAALTADLASSFRSAYERAGLSLDVDCPPLSEVVHVDHDMWEKIVLNLLSNAFKFTAKGGVRVSLRERGARVELAVRDTGVGIPADELPRVFERFHRVEGQRARTHEGTGIGLSLVRELVQLHGGDIRVESVAGEGATFRLTLPFGAAHLPADQIGEARELVQGRAGAGAFVEEAMRWLPDAQGERTESKAASRGARIVLADDNADMRDYVRRLLEGGGYEVEPFADGAAALDAALARAPDLVLCDVMMPVLDGFGLLRALRAAPTLEGLPVIMLSARAGQEARIEGLAAGADDYMVKPFSGRELLARVDGAIALARQRRKVIERERALNHELEQRVRDRTFELSQANRDLQAKAVELQQLNDRLLHFTYVSSHDLQEPLRKIETFSDLLVVAIQEGNDADVQYAVPIIRTAAKRSRQLIRDLLAYSRSTSAELNLVSAPLLEAVDTALFDLSEAIKGADASVAVETNGLFVQADRTQIVNLISNLVGNAIKYRKAGEAPQVKVTARRLPDRGDEIVVEDNGIGFPSAYAQSIFEPFKRLHTVAEYPGSGIGLAICRTIANRHGWSIEATSRVGEGARFVVSIPAE